MMGPVEKKKKLMTGRVPMSLYGEGKVILMTIRVMPPFCMAVSKDIAIICKISMEEVNVETISTWALVWRKIAANAAPKM